MREDLETAYEELQSTNEELETTNEELQSSIEELETTNEELQSTNEELETTNEELQSGNEELETMNDEMRIRTDGAGRGPRVPRGRAGQHRGGRGGPGPPTCRVRSWNRGAEDLWGLRADEVSDEEFFSLDFGLPTDVSAASGAAVPEVAQAFGPGRRTGHEPYRPAHRLRCVLLPVRRAQRRRRPDDGRKQN